MGKIILGLVIFSCGVLFSVATSYLELKEHVRFYIMVFFILVLCIAICSFPVYVYSNQIVS